MSEKGIVTKILRYLRTVPGCFCWKEHGGMYGTAGLPDIIACVNGRFVAFEVKAPSGKTTKLQEATIRKILKAGGVAAVIRSVDEVKIILEKYDLLQGTKQ
jgi:Holliday junction resolvase